MEAIILAGGLGTRLRQEVPDLPKPMAPIAGKPFLEYLLLDLAHKGFTKIILSTGYLSHVISDYFGERFLSLNLVYAIEDQPLGTGGGIRKALQACSEESVFVFNGDTYLDLEANQVKQLWSRLKQPVVVVRQVPDTGRYGRIELDSDGFITAFTEKGIVGEGVINAGCYVLPRHALDTFPAEQPFSLENDYLKQIIQNQKIAGFVTDGYFIDIGIPEDYLRAQEELLQLFKNL